MRRCEARTRTGRCRKSAVILVVNQRTQLLEEICRRHAWGRGIYRDIAGDPIRGVPKERDP